MDDAVSTHEQGTTTPSAANITAALTFEQGLFTAQATDTAAGSLSVNGATGGPTNLAAQNYYPGINDSLGGDPTGAKFNPASMTLYTAWANSTNAAQASIARGENIFNTAPLTITNVSGLNGQPGAPATIKASCSFCHDAPNLGHRSLPLPMDTGQAHLAADETDPNIIAGLNQLNAPSLPVYQITGCKVNGVAVTYVTTDPGKALSTGLCADVNHLKVPHPSRPRRPRPLLPQRLRRHARPGRQLLQRPLPDGPQPRPEDRPRQLPQRAVNLLRFSNSQLTDSRLETNKTHRPHNNQ